MNANTFTADKAAVFIMLDTKLNEHDFGLEQDDVAGGKTNYIIRHIPTGRVAASYAIIAQVSAFIDGLERQKEFLQLAVRP